MKNLKNKVAVITGGASGMGLAFAHRFAAAGMSVAIADIEEAALTTAVAELTAAGAEVFGGLCDVSDIDSFRRFAADADAALGPAQVVCLNAGVAGSGDMVDLTMADWNWLLGVNLWGVIHGIRVFVPLMIEQGGPAHVVNTASMAGLISVPYLAAYNVSKHGVVTLSETLHRDLQLGGHADIGVSVLCPGLVMTNIFESQRNRPDELADGEEARGLSALVGGDGDGAATEDAIGAFGQILSPDDVGAAVVDAVREDRFYILTHPDSTEALVRTRCDDIVEARHPTPLRR